MAIALFASDLHGREGRYGALFEAVVRDRPGAVFLGGDLLPHVRSGDGQRAFIEDVLASGFGRTRHELGEAYPRVFLIPGNDDVRAAEAGFKSGQVDGLWTYLHLRRDMWGTTPVFGYACVPPTPFRLKDWERFDVSRYVDPGCVSPEEGVHSVPVDEHDVRYGTIQKDLQVLVGDDDLSGAVFMLHSPPYDTRLDRADLDGRKVDGVPVDVHIGSIAIRRLFEARQPLLGLHGHVHESARLTGAWKDRIGRTVILSAAHDGPELALVRFDVAEPEAATRELLSS